MRIDAISTYNIPEIQNKNQNNNLGFEDYLKNYLDKVNDIQINAENATIDMIKGDAKDLHEVMIATEEAKLALELTVQLRNKLVDAYQEIMKMQI